ncbi:multidrug effflux MFS transporter [Isoalcanivorax beigongshangi]|uniref:Bcr/CflA family efflux transporter n=1 Tax=Isoalcanivorax beigongshangi TaxID=3238810 RepID=A0ABV4AGL8_9GAMM
MQVVSPVRLAVVLALLSALGPLAIDTYLPALVRMADDLGGAVHQVETSVSLYLIGAAFGQLFGGQLSDRLGRKQVAVGGLLLFLFASIGIVLADSITMLYLMRLLQAFGGGAAVVISAASVRDFYNGREAARVLTTIGLIMLVAPLIAPAVGSLLLHLWSWESIFMFLALYAAIMLLVLVRGLPTRPPRPQPGGALAGYGRVLCHRQAMGFILANAMGFSAMFMFITDSAFLYMTHFGATEALFPVLFGANIVLMLLLNRLNVVLLRHYDPAVMLRWGLTLQLLGASVFLALAVTGLLTLALAVPLVMLVVGAVSLIVPNAMASFMAFFDRDAGAASGLNGALQFLLAGILGFLLTHFHTESVLPMAVAMLGSVLLANVAFYGLARGDGSQT